MAKQYKNYVNGEWKTSENEITIYAPANGEELGSVPAMSQAEVDEVYAAAKAALPAWRALSYAERAAYLHKAADILERDAEKIGQVLSKEISKGLKSAIGEVVRTAEIIHYAAEEGLRLEGEVLEGGAFDAGSKKKIAVVRREPVGLVLAISPFNYPVNLAGSKIAPALIAGDVVAFKPPTQGSISGLLLVEAFVEAGIPAGVLNSITGRGSVIGDYIVEHKAVDFINFTGSTPVGENIGRLAAMRPIMLELGGKDAAIVLEDADLDLTAKNIVAGAFDGIPAGVLNSITGRGSVIGDYIVEHKAVDFINFTGSTPVGENIGRLAAMRPIMLELGGKDAAIVLEDADLDLTAKNIVAGAFDYSGQRCTAIKRVLVMDSVADELVEKVTALVGNITVGMPEESASVTPLIDTKAADFVQGLIDDAVEQGATAKTELKREGNLIYPAVFDHVTTDMRLAWEEPFGPVLPFIRVSSVEEAIKISNESEFGLQGAVFTQDYPRAFAIAEQLEVGTVHINNKTQRGTDNFPFLGVKGSGAGTQGVKYSIEAMTRVKSTVFDIANY